MKQFFEFVVNHWMLWSGFVLLTIVIFIEEIRGRVQGVSRVSPQELTHLINKEEAVVLDVRDHHAFMKGHIIGAINIPHTQMAHEIEKLKKYQNKPLIIVCSNGQTAPQEGAKLRKLNFEKVYFLSGGLAAWQAANFPLTHKG